MGCADPRRNSELAHVEGSLANGGPPKAHGRTQGDSISSVTLPGPLAASIRRWSGPWVSPGAGGDEAVTGQYKLTYQSSQAECANWDMLGECGLENEDELGMR